MRDELVERVARAINDVVIASLVPGREFSPTDCARAALASIEAAGYVVVPREPTEKMLGICVDPKMAKGYWRLMIDVAREKDKMP